MASNVLIEGVIFRVIDSREVKIPFRINGEGNNGEGSYFQWGDYDTKTLGANVDLLERIRDAVLDADTPSIR
jgi:hypothetical protein